MSDSQTSILSINGPNLNLTGARQTEIYGNETLEEIFARITAAYPTAMFKIVQSNHEGVLIDALHETDAYDGLMINAGGLTHTSVSLRDALAFVEKPKVEVHLSNLWKRESFRHTSLLSPVCDGVISGFGGESYALAAAWLVKRLQN